MPTVMVRVFPKAILQLLIGIRIRRDMETLMDRLILEPATTKEKEQQKTYIRLTIGGESLLNKAIVRVN